MGPARVLPLIVAAVTAVAATGPAPSISVHEAGGAYTVSARFTVAEAEAVVREVLTDYPNIPRFMPGVRSSEVLHRQDGVVRVRQEAVSTYMMFSKRVHLLLDVEERAGVIRFRDGGHESFAVYEGAWIVERRDERTEIRYELTAQPAFSVPGFVLRKLLNRDAGVMIERLCAEIAARAPADKTAAYAAVP
jgi:carbon monoxide dehydrogenase subunit G